MMTSKTTLSVIIVTWNSADVIRGCLTTLRDSVIPGSVETIVVDNGSADEVCLIIERDFPWVTLIRRPDNLGFARANNLAMSSAHGANLLLLNPDVLLTDRTVVAQMLRTLDTDPTIGMIGCRLTFADGTHQVGDAGFRPSTLNMVCHGLGIGHLLSRVRTLYLVRPDRYGERTVDVDWICGACLLVRSAVVAAAGGLDERLFLYAEDVEWGCRIRRSGRRVVYVARLKVVHLQATSENQAQANLVARVEAPASSSTVSVRWLQSLLGLYASLNNGRWRIVVHGGFVIGFSARAAAYGVLAALRPRRRMHYLKKRLALLAYARAAARIRG